MREFQKKVESGLKAGMNWVVLMLLPWCAIAPPPSTQADPAQKATDAITAKGKETSATTSLEELIEAHNKIRMENQLPLLKVDATLVRAALGHARDMAGRKLMTHDGTDGSTPAERVAREGYRYRRTAENVAYMSLPSRSPRPARPRIEGWRAQLPKIMDGWMNSTGHRQNILGEFQDIGAACALGEDGNHYYAVEFGTAWPTLDTMAERDNLLSAVNALREERKLAPLLASEALRQVAGTLSEDNAKRKKLNATTADGTDPLRELAQRDAGYQRLGFAVANGQATAQEVLDIWLGSSSARSSILGPFTHAGTAVAQSDDGSPYWTLVLGQRR